MPHGVGVLSFLTHSFLPHTASSAVLRVSRWPRLRERARCVLYPGVCEPDAELMSRAAEGRLRREKEREEAPRTGLPGGQAGGQQGAAGQVNSPRAAPGGIHLLLVSPGTLPESEVSAPTLSA